mmetsp:Transcript_108038/g.335864  ORF Transcript_108038/g.335864 Transcript_108038/m.335864 type:complete len:252 (-) Transcript_108038:1-756(-)
MAVSSAAEAADRCHKHRSRADNSETWSIGVDDGDDDADCSKAALPALAPTPGAAACKAVPRWTKGGTTACRTSAVCWPVSTADARLLASASRSLTCAASKAAPRSASSSRFSNDSHVLTARAQEVWNSSPQLTFRSCAASKRARRRATRAQSPPNMLWRPQHCPEPLSALARTSWTTLSWHSKSRSASRGAAAAMRELSNLASAASRPASKVSTASGVGWMASAMRQGGLAPGMAAAGAAQPGGSDHGTRA